MSDDSRLIAVLGGHILQDTSHSRGFRTSTLADFANPYRIFGDCLRGEAAASLYRDDPQRTRVVVLGGVTPLHADIPDAPHLSAIIKAELVEARVPESVVDEVDMDPLRGTYEQLHQLVGFLSRVVQPGEVLVISNRWHEPRIQAMLAYAEGLEALRSARPRTRFVAAEDRLIETQPDRWCAPIAEAFGRPEMRALMREEFRGAQQVADGTY